MVKESSIGEIMRKLHKIAKRKLKGPHDYSHVKRLIKYAKILNSKYNGNWKVIEASILLHEFTKNNPKNSKKYLKGFSNEEIKNVIHCIETHDCFKNKRPKTIESKIVQDSDTLDKFGAIGVARGFMSASEKGLDLPKAKKEYKHKRLYAYSKLNLKESKKIAKLRFKFTKLFFKTIDKELVR
jgi:uncharacterized protein